MGPNTPLRLPTRATENWMWDGSTMARKYGGMEPAIDVLPVSEIYGMGKVESKLDRPWMEEHRSLMYNRSSLHHPSRKPESSCHDR